MFSSPFFGIVGAYVKAESKPIRHSLAFHYGSKNSTIPVEVEFPEALPMSTLQQWKVPRQAYAASHEQAHPGVGKG